MARRAEPISKRTAKNGMVTYTFQLDVGVRPDGNRDRRRFTYRTMAEARREYRKISAEVAAGTYVPGHNLTVGEYLEQWTSSRRDVRTATRENYRQSLRPVVDQLGGLKLQQLTRQHVEDLVDARLSTGRAVRPDLSAKAQGVLQFVQAHGGSGTTYREVEAEFGVHGPKQLDRLRAAGLVDRPARGRYVAANTAKADQAAAAGVSASTVNTMLTLLSSALRQALADGLVVRNVAEHVERPKHTAPKTPAWSADDAARFREHVRAERENALWLLTLCGLRRSEVLGLAWSAVNLDAGTITVEAGRVAVKGGTEIGDPKSWRSARTIPITAEIVDALRALKTAQARERLVIGAGWPDTGLVAVNADGTPIHPRTYSAMFQRLAAAASVPKNPAEGRAEHCGHDADCGRRVSGRRRCMARARSGDDTADLRACPARGPDCCGRRLVILIELPGRWHTLGTLRGF